MTVFPKTHLRGPKRTTKGDERAEIKRETSDFKRKTISLQFVSHLLLFLRCSSFTAALFVLESVRVLDVVGVVVLAEHKKRTNICINAAPDAHQL